MHEQSETVQRADGKWINVYGRHTPHAGNQIPGTQAYNTMREAVEAARNRSSAAGMRERITAQRERRPVARTPEERMAYQPRESLVPRVERDIGDWLLFLRQPGMLDARHYSD